MISRKHKFAFMHIPKCGGCSLKYHLIKRCGRQPIIKAHIPLPELFKEFDLNPEAFYKFTFVRNPWDRIVSLYFFWLTQTPDSYFYRWDYKQVDFLKDNSISFKDFVKLIHLKDPIICQKPHSFPYIDHFIGDPSLFDFIGRVENFQEDFDIICDKIGLQRKELFHRNKSKHKPYTEYYDDETREIVAEKYAKDIEYFNYEFGE